jgi:hypothetical protein
MDNLDPAVDNQDPNVAPAPDPNAAPPAPPAPPADWKAGLSDDLKAHPGLAKFKDSGALATSYLELQKKIGYDKIAFPADITKAKPEDFNAVYDRLGRPKTADEYKMPTDIKLPEGYPAVKEETIKWFKGISHKYGLNQTQTAGLYKDYMENEGNQFKQFQMQTEESRQAAEAKLRQEYGATYDAKIALVKKTFLTYADDEAKALFEEGLGNNPAIIKLFANIGSKLSEAGLIKGDSYFTMNPEEAKAEIAKIQGNKTHPYYDKVHPEHAGAMKRIEELFRMAYPEGAKA